jgi:hypothetical protein
MLALAIAAGLSDIRHRDGGYCQRAAAVPLGAPLHVLEHARMGGRFIGPPSGGRTGRCEFVAPACCSTGACSVGIVLTALSWTLCVVRNPALILAVLGGLIFASVERRKSASDGFLSSGGNFHRLLFLTPGCFLRQINDDDAKTICNPQKYTHLFLRGGRLSQPQVK